MHRKVITRMKNFSYEKKVKQFDSFSVTYLTPWWGKYRKRREENKNAGYIKLSQAQMGNPQSWLQTLLSSSTGSVMYLTTFGFPAQITRVCKEGAASLKVRNKIVLLERQKIFHSPTRVHRTAKLSQQQFHYEISMQKSTLSPTISLCVQLLLVNPARIFKKISRSEINFLNP